MNPEPKAAKPLLLSLKSSVWPWWLLAITYWVVCCLMHLRFSIWLVRQRATQSGHMAYSDLMPALVIAGGIGLALWIVLSLRRSPRPWLTGAYWLLWLLAFGLIDHYLTFSINEHAHYPQYGLLALLLARAMDPQRKRWVVGRVLFWTTLMGMGDELSQYLWITTSYSEYLDFNDFLTNLIAAAAGMLLYYGPAATPPDLGERRPPVVELVVTGALVVLVLLGLQSGRLVPSSTERIAPGGIMQLADGSHRLYLQRGPDLYGVWTNGPRNGRYYVMSPMPTLMLMLLAGFTFASYASLRYTMPSMRGNQLDNPASKTPPAGTAAEQGARS